MFSGLRNWFKNLKKDDADDMDVRQALEKIRRQLEARPENVKAVDSKKAEELQRQLEAEKREKERIQAEARRKDEALRQAEAQKAEVQRQLEAQRQDLEQVKAIKHATAMSDKYFLKLCAFGDALEIKKAIINGANVNAKDNNGFTALIYAAYYGRMEIAELLIKHGANVKAKNNRRETALMLAKTNGRTETANLLRSYGAK